MDRRQALKNSSLIGMGMSLAACGGSQADDTPRKKNILFIHGAWHCGIHWNRVSGALSAAGHNVFAIDLPGAGLNAIFPESYVRNDFAALSTEPSPLAGLQLGDYRDAVVAQIRRMSATGKVTVVAHSLGGVTATVAVEAVPELVQRVVYVTALVPVRYGSLLDYGGLPQNTGSRTTSIWVADPLAVGAARINPRNPDPAYIELGRQAFYNDLSTEDYLRFAAFLVPDVPLAVAAADARGTAARWGSVPRSYVRCTRDQSQPLALQDPLIADADALTPGNRFDVKTLESSHSPFASMPAQLAALIDAMV